MDKGGNKRSGKVVSNHSTRVEGLNKFIQQLEDWPEVASIRLGEITAVRSVGRKSKKLKADASSSNGLRPAHPHKRPKGGGGFEFKATRWAMVGQMITGIKCAARHGSHVQLVVLGGDNLDALKARLCREGYATGW